MESQRQHAVTNEDVISVDGDSLESSNASAQSAPSPAAAPESPKTVADVFASMMSNRMASSKPMAAMPQPTRGSSTVGRNDPCPCGSGKKFKKCCGRNEI
jgi:uncharacterized protein YecA (UPF0149 family)